MMKKAKRKAESWNLHSRRLSLRHREDVSAHNEDFLAKDSLSKERLQEAHGESPEVRNYKRTNELRGISLCPLGDSERGADKTPFQAQGFEPGQPQEIGIDTGNSAQICIASVGMFAESNLSKGECIRKCNERPTFSLRLCGRCWGLFARRRVPIFEVSPAALNSDNSGFA